MSQTNQGMVMSWNQLAVALHKLLSHSSRKSRCRKEQKASRRRPVLTPSAVWGVLPDIWLSCDMAKNPNQSLWTYFGPITCRLIRGGQFHRVMVNHPGCASVDIACQEKSRVRSFAVARKGI